MVEYPVASPPSPPLSSVVAPLVCAQQRADGAVGIHHRPAVLRAKGHGAAVGAGVQLALLGEAVAAGLLPEDGVLRLQWQPPTQQQLRKHQLISPVIEPPCAGYKCTELGMSHPRRFLPAGAGTPTRKRASPTLVVVGWRWLQLSCQRRQLLEGRAHRSVAAPGQGLFALRAAVPGDRRAGGRAGRRAAAGASGMSPLAAQRAFNFNSTFGISQVLAFSPGKAADALLVNLITGGFLTVGAYQGREHCGRNCVLVSSP